jgi:predicted transcriptional regulator
LGSRGITIKDSNYNLKLYEEVKEDLKFVSSSTVRTKIIICLTEGTTRLKDLKEDLGIDSSTILHAMKKLESKDLIYKKGDEYFISQTGIVVGLKLIDIIKMLFIFKEKEDLIFDSDVPLDIVSEFKDLHFSHFILPRTADFDFARHFSNYIYESDNIRALAPICNTTIIETCKMIVENCKRMEVILNPSVFRKSREYLEPDVFEQLIDSINEEKIKIWSIEQDLNTSFFLTDKFVILGFIITDGKDFILKDMISYHPNAIEWGNRLFNYYLENSNPLKL